MQKILPWQLVRMRSAVRIRPAAPENSRNHRISGVFCCDFAGFCVGQNVGQAPCPTPRPTRRNIWRGAESARQEVLLSCLAFCWIFTLHDLRHEISHGLRSLILHLPGGVGVGAEGEARIVVSQHAANGLYVYAVLEGQGGEGVPLWHNKDKSKNPCIARS